MKKVAGKLILNLTIEFGPIIVFLFASELLGFIQATTLFVIATVVSLVLSYWERKEIAWFPILVGFTIILSGVLTIVFDNPFFLIIKDTIYNGLFAVVLFVGLFFKMGLLKPLFKGLFSMTDTGWRILSFRWAIMFTLLTVTNEVARINLRPHDWVVFKGFATVATIIFSVYQFRLSKKERLPDSTPWGMRIVRK